MADAFFHAIVIEYIFYFIDYSCIEFSNKMPLYTSWNEVLGQMENQSELKLTNNRTIANTIDQTQIHTRDDTYTNIDFKCT